MKKHTLFGKKLITFVTMLLCFVIAFSAVACGGGSDPDDPNTPPDTPPVVTPGGDGDGSGGGESSNKLEISLLASSDGYGTRALELQGVRFEQAFANKTYTNTKTGETFVGIDFVVHAEEHSPNPSASWLEDTNTMYNAKVNFGSLAGAIANGWVTNIDSIMRTKIPGEDVAPVDKFYDEMRYAFGIENEDSTTNTEGFDYYSFPYAQTISGFMYDVDRFDKGFYVAHPNADPTTVNPYDSEIIADFTVNFVDKDGEKSVGPNGNAGDYDDGLPSSMLEFIVLCEYLAYEGVAPFNYTGMYPEYMALGMGALLFNLLGEKNAKATMEYETDSLNVVYGFEEDALFSGAESILKPKVTQISMEESSGYYHTWTLENYMCLALGELLVDNEWQSYSAKMNDDHLTAQYNFIFGIEPDQETVAGAMLSEGSYWYNEAVDATSFLQYEMNYGKTADERGIAWMPLPVNIFTSVTGEDKDVFVEELNITENTKGRNQTLDDVGTGSLMVNANIADNDAKMEAVKDYILFVCSNAEINKFAKDAGYTKDLKFTYDEEIMATAPKYIQNTFKLFAESNIVTAYSSKKTWRERGQFTFRRSYDSYFFQPNDALNYNGGCIEFFDQYGAVEGFKYNIIDKDEWWAYYKGPSTDDPPTESFFPDTTTPVVFEK